MSKYVYPEDLNEGATLKDGTRVFQVREEEGYYRVALSDDRRINVPPYAKFHLKQD